jgi:adenylosuccinate synthase
MISMAVIGAGFGDEGKGLVTAHLCAQCRTPLVIRFSGGQQAGHHVVLDDNHHHVFSNFGSGSYQGAPTYWSPFCTMDPIGIVNELDVLLAKGVQPVLYIDERCPVTTPFDVACNRSHEAIHQHGSCGLGVGATMQREADRYSLVFRDLYCETAMQIKLEMIGRYYDSRVVIDDFLFCRDRLIRSESIKVCDGMRFAGFDTYVFEGSQGLLLDQHIGFYPHVTRSNTGTRNILQMGHAPEIFLVTRAYQTRHGNGPMTNEHIPHNIKENPYEQNISGGFQGSFRRALLDLDLLRYGIWRDRYIRENRNKILVITCLDLIENEYRFTRNKEIVYCDDQNDFVLKILDFLQIEKALLSFSPISGQMKAPFDLSLLSQE